MCEKRIHIEINNIPYDWLQRYNLTFKDFKEQITFLAQVFKNKYNTIFPNIIDTTDKAEFVRFTYNGLFPIRKLQGFDRMIQIFNRKDANGLIYSCNVAQYFMDRFEIELEPDVSIDGKTPDLKLSNENCIFFIECKTIDISNFFQKQKKAEIASKLRSQINTPNQIDLFIDYDYSPDEIVKHVLCYKDDIEGATKRLNFKISDNLDISIEPRDTYSSTGFVAVFEMIIHYIEDNDRKPGYVFIRNGSATGIYGPVIDFEKCLEKKRNKSKSQCVKGYPYILSIDATNILGNREYNLSHIERWFQPNINKRFSGVILTDYFEANKDLGRNKMILKKNDYATYELPNEIIETINEINSA